MSHNPRLNHFHSDNTTLHFAYDPNSNTTLLQTPTPSDHTFDYNGVNKRTAYTTPLTKYGKIWGQVIVC